MDEQKKTILVVDGNAGIQKILTILLEGENYRVLSSPGGAQAIGMCADVKPSLILYDIDLPGMNGKDLVVGLRGWSHVPIIIVSSHSSDWLVADLLNAGANDCVSKPFNVDVLLARINVALRTRRARELGDSEMQNGLLRMDLVRHQVFVNDERVAFTPKEYDLLRFFMVNLGKMLTHKDILRAVWGGAHTDDKSYLRVFIGQIRQKIEVNPACQRIIVTEPGVGYRMDVVRDLALPRAHQTQSVGAVDYRSVS